MASASELFSSVPAGSVLSYAGASAPSGWLLCDGTAVSRTTYAALYAVIGDTYGAGDGSTTFDLPDLRGRAVFGKDDMGGSAASRLTGNPDNGSGIDGSALGNAGGQEHYDISQEGYDPAQLPGAGTGSQRLVAWIESATANGIPTSRSNTPPGIIMNYIIKA